MVNFREVNDDDILKDWLCLERILRNVSKDNRQFVQSQFDKLYDDFMRYLDYWNKKYYRNGFVDGSQIAMGCFEE